MATQLTDIWEIADRSIFEKIRLILVEFGYLPDITLYENTPTGIAQWEAAMSQIVMEKGFAIELFGASSSQKKYIKKSPRIVYMPKRIFPGDLGGDPDSIYRSSGVLFNAKTRPPQTSELQFDISLVSNGIKAERVMNSVIGLAFSKRAYVPFYTNVDTGDTEEFFVTQMSYRDVPDTKFGIQEKIYTYKAHDLWDREFDDRGTVSPLLEVIVDGYVDGEYVGELIVAPEPGIAIVQSPSNSFTFNYINIEGDWTIDWGDGTFEVYSNAQSFVGHVWEDPSEAHFIRVIDFNPDQLLRLDIGGANVGSIQFIPGLVNLTELEVDDNLLTELELFEDMVSLTRLNARYNNISEITTHASWVNLQEIFLQSNILTSFQTHIEWVDMYRLLINDNLLTDLVIYKEWAWEYVEEIFPGYVIRDPGRLYAQDNLINYIQPINDIFDQLSQAGVEDLRVRLYGDDMAGVSPRVTAANGVAAVANLENNLSADLDYNDAPYILEMEIVPINSVPGILPTDIFGIFGIVGVDGTLTIDWGDGQIEVFNNDPNSSQMSLLSHDYADRDISYTIKLYDTTWETVTNIVLFGFYDIVPCVSNIIFPKNLEALESATLSCEGYLTGVNWPINAYMLERLNPDVPATNYQFLNITETYENFRDIRIYGDTVTGGILTDQITLGEGMVVKEGNFQSILIRNMPLTVGTVNYILSRAEELTREFVFAGTDTISITLDGVLMPAPDGTSGGYDGITAKAILQARGATVTTN